MTEPDLPDPADVDPVDADDLGSIDTTPADKVGEPVSEALTALGWDLL